MINSTINPTFSPLERRLWDSLGKAPQREFPDFGPNFEAELRKIKHMIRNECKEHSFNAKLRGSNARDAGLLLVDDYKNPHSNASPHRYSTIDEADIDSLFTKQVMAPYFSQALDTQNDKTAPSDRGIPHDYDTRKQRYKDPHAPISPDAWLPGVFLIDEIFKALLSLVDEKIRRANSAVADFERRRAKLSVFATAEDKKGLETAERRKKDLLGDLEDFASAFSTNQHDHWEAGIYLKFINFIPRDKARSDEELTFIRLVKSDDYILGVLVHVGDWAGGSHSSGSAIH